MAKPTRGELIFSVARLFITVISMNILAMQITTVLLVKHTLILFMLIVFWGINRAMLWLLLLLLLLVMLKLLNQFLIWIF
jgi:hypothetical protein